MMNNKCDRCIYDTMTGFISRDPCDGCHNYSNFLSKEEYEDAKRERKENRV